MSIILQELKNPLSEKDNLTVGYSQHDDYDFIQAHNPENEDFYEFTKHHDGSERITKSIIVLFNGGKHSWPLKPEIVNDDNAFDDLAIKINSYKADR